jgi:C1q domain
MEYGAADVKQTVYFYAQRTAAVPAAETVITFETTVINLGEGLAANTGIFTAPVSGVYFFAFDGAPASVVLKNGTKDVAEVAEGSLSATVELAAGDTVTLVSKATVTLSPRHYSGLLLKQTAFP